MPMVSSIFKTINSVPRKYPCSNSRCKGNIQLNCKWLLLRNFRFQVFEVCIKKLSNSDFSPKNLGLTLFYFTF